MGKFQVNMNVKAVDCDLEDISALAESMDEYSSFQICVDSDHATYIEFGTNGKTGWDSPPPKRSPNAKRRDPEVLVNITDWYMERSGATDRELARSLAYPVYKKIMREGIPPQPFIRPAVISVDRDLKTGGALFNEDTTMDDIVDVLIERMRDNLRENRTLYGDERLFNSIIVRRGDEIPDMDMEGDMTVLGQDIWNDEYKDLNGDPTRAMERKRRLNSLRFGGNI